MHTPISLILIVIYFNVLFCFVLFGFIAHMHDCKTTKITIKFNPSTIKQNRSQTLTSWSYAKTHTQTQKSKKNKNKNKIKKMHTKKTNNGYQLTTFMHKLQ